MPRGTIQKNKDWNWLKRFRVPGNIAAERHYPEEQGLKHQSLPVGTYDIVRREALSRRTRIETKWSVVICTNWLGPRGTIQKNKDWNFGVLHIYPQHNLAERHYPEEQGLKHQEYAVGRDLAPGREALSRRTRIETINSLSTSCIYILPRGTIQKNKDWNIDLVLGVNRALILPRGTIQKNKDWNSWRFIHQY